MAQLVLALGLLLCIEGLVLALAPGRVEDLLETLRRLPLEARRLIGLIAIATGVALAALARVVGL